MQQPCEWNVDVNEDGTGVVVSFNEIGDDGVEVFTTCLPPSTAVVFATAVLNMVLESELYEDEEDDGTA